jgi:hypothetical protein
MQVHNNRKQSLTGPPNLGLRSKKQGKSRGGTNMQADVQETTAKMCWAITISAVTSYNSAGQVQAGSHHSRASRAAIATDRG